MSNGDWYAVTLGSVADFRKGISYKTEDYRSDGDGYPFITIKCFLKGGGYEPAGLKFFGGYFTEADKLLEGDVLFAVTDLTRAGDIVGSPLQVLHSYQQVFFLSSMDCMKIEPDTNLLDKKFLYYRMMLPDVRRRMVAYSAGSTVLHLDTKQVPRISISLPKQVTIQKKIACILQTIDRAIEKTETLIDKYQQIKAGLMHDLFTRGIGADGKLRPPREKSPELYQKTPIGWIPKEWDAKPLTSIASYQHGRPFPSSDYAEEGILLLRPGNLHISGYVVFDKMHSTRIPESWAKQESSYIVTKGDILMNLTAQSLDDEFLGRVCLYEQTEKSLLNQRIARFKASSVEHHFLYWILRSRQFRAQIESTSQGTKVQHLYNRDLDRVMLGAPRKTREQEEISAKLDTVSEKIRSEIVHLQKAKQQKKALMNDLLTGKVPVQVDEPESKPEAVHV